MCWHFDEDGFLVLRARLRPEEGRVVQEALEAVTDELRAEHTQGQSPPATPAGQARPATAVGQGYPRGAVDPGRPGRPEALVAMARPPSPPGRL